MPSTVGSLALILCIPRLYKYTKVDLKINGDKGNPKI